MTPVEWLLGDDTGSSSKTLLAVMTGVNYEGASLPWDNDDFGRCYRLLKRFPEWRVRLPEVAQQYPEWGPMVAAWDELTTMYEKICEPDGQYTARSYAANRGQAAVMYERMQGLIAAGQNAASAAREAQPC